VEIEPSNPPTSENKIRRITWKEFFYLCNTFKRKQLITSAGSFYGVPVGGWFVANGLKEDGVSVLQDEYDFKGDNLLVGDDIIVVDDIVDSGKTIKEYKDKGFKTASLFVKEGAEVLPDEYLVEVPRSTWVKFPWESEREIEDTVIRQLEYIGENPNREGLKNTPKRIVKSWKELYSGYGQNPSDIIKSAMFSEHSNYDQIVLLKDIDFFSMCEHHMMPFFGKVHIGYLPGKNVVGVSKIARMVECFARRLQIQERLTEDIASTMFDIMEARGVGVVIEATHLCMVARGVKKREPIMVTSSVKGEFLGPMKDEFFSLIGR